LRKPVEAMSGPRASKRVLLGRGRALRGASSGLFVVTNALLAAESELVARES
jgi:hypothetical protein